MEWIEAQESSGITSPVFAALADKALERRPDAPWVKLAAAQQATVEKRYGEAIILLEEVSAPGMEERIPWAAFSLCYRKLGRIAEALEACERGLAVNKDDAPIHFERGAIFKSEGQHGKAEAAFLKAAELGSYHDPCLQILEPIAQTHDGTALLEKCAELEARFGPSAVFRSNRAIAYSMLGLTEEARKLVDLEQHVRTGSITEFFDGDLAALNSNLAEEAKRLAMRSGASEMMINARPQLAERPLIRQLQSLVKTAVETYLDEGDQRGLSDCLPLPLERAQLLTGITMLRADGHNGQHIHRESVVSIVYHVSVPTGLTRDDPDAGALKVGAVDHYTGGHKACWGERLIQPRPGQITIFPAHFHHDVVPTGSDELRISIPSDVHPVT